MIDDHLAQLIEEAEYAVEHAEEVRFRPVLLLELVLELVKALPSEYRTPKERHAHRID